MINKIIDILGSEKIEKYLINENVTESSELFFIKHELDVRRAKNVSKYCVTVYRDFEKDGTQMRGSANANIFPTMSGEEISERLKNAYFAAQFVYNPKYELVKGNGEKAVIPAADPVNVTEAAQRMANAIFEVDTQKDAFINSAEIFAEKTNVRIVNSDGVDAAFEKFTVKGEFIVQSTAEEDVELYRDFEYDDVDENALKEKVKQALSSAKDRSRAKRCLESGNYDVILSGENVGTIMLDYYLDKSNAANVYAKYSDYAAGKEIQGENVIGEKLNITCAVSDPYDHDGIKMTDQKLISNGKLETLQGNNRFSQYLNVKATGTYNKIRLDCGSTSFEDMKKKPHLYVASFSDFQISMLTGHFGGEIRLAYLYDGEKTTIVTGGSINGAIDKAQSNFVFSKERYKDSKYDGPLAVLIENIAVAGSK